MRKNNWRWKGTEKEGVGVGVRTFLVNNGVLRVVHVGVVVAHFWGAGGDAAGKAGGGGHKQLSKVGRVGRERVHQGREAVGRCGLPLVQAKATAEVGQVHALSEYKAEEEEEEEEGFGKAGFV